MGAIAITAGVAILCAAVIGFMFGHESGRPALGQFAVTSGALPNPAATLAVQGAWTGGMPAFFLDNSNA